MPSNSETASLKEETFTLKQFSNETGFPVDLIKRELLMEENIQDDDQLPLSLLRKKMLAFLDSTMGKESPLS